MGRHQTSAITWGLLAGYAAVAAGCTTGGGGPGSADAMNDEGAPLGDAGDDALEPCPSGTVDRNGDPADGCECEIHVEQCDGRDNDCDGELDPPACSEYGWTRTIVGDDLENVFDLAIDGEGNRIVAGNFSGSSVDLDPGAGTDARSGDNDAFLMQLSPLGERAWAHTFGVANRDAIGAVAISPEDDSIAVIGVVREGTDIDPDPATETIAEETGDFVAKFAPDGSFLWARFIGAVDVDYNDVTVASDGSVAVVGSFGEILDLDPTIGVDEHVPRSSNDALLTMFTADGDYLFSATWGSSDRDEALGVAAVPSEAAVVVVGRYAGDINVGSIDLDALGNSDVFIAQWTVDGSLAWAMSYGSEDQDDVRSVAVSKAGEIFLGGGFYEAVADGGSAALHLFVAKLDETRSVEWMRAWQTDIADNWVGIAAQDDSSVWVAANFEGSVDVDPSDGSSIFDGGDEGAFLVRLTESGAFDGGYAINADDPDTRVALTCVAVLPDNVPTIGGTFSGTADFDPGVGMDLRTTATSSDGFVTTLILESLDDGPF